MNTVSISVTGQQELDAVLRQMTAKLSHSVVGSAHVAAAKPLVEKAKLLAPEGPNGYLVDSIGSVRLSQKRADSVGEVEVGPRRRGGYKGYHGHLVERGTRQRQTKRGANRGIMPKRPFMEPAFHATQLNVREGIRLNLRKQILSAVRKGRA